MNVTEILSMIRLKYPHSYQDTDVIMMLNDIQKRIFRTMYKPEVLSTFDIVASNPFYPIPFSPENIIDVVVNGVEYPYQNIKYDSQGEYYYITNDNSIGLYPTPIADSVGGLTVFHYKEPSSLTSSSTPELDAVWHMMLVCHACKEIATMQRDDIANVFIGEINELDRQFYRSHRAKPHKIQDVYGVRGGTY